MTFEQHAFLIPSREKLKRGFVGTVLHRWIYVLVIVPFVTEWIEEGRLPKSPRNLVSEVTLAVIVGLCVALLYRKASQYEALSQTDDLTGLGNRRRFRRELGAQMARARRFGVPLTLAYLDVDRFKKINDTFGHAEGDRVLVATAEFLRQAVREHVDECFRIGGDEFAVLFTGANPTQSLAALERGRGPAAAARCLSEHGVTFCVGAVALEGTECAEAFVRRADRHLYAAKRGEARQGPADGAFRRIRAMRPSRAD